MLDDWFVRLLSSMEWKMRNEKSHQKTFTFRSSRKSQVRKKSLDYNIRRFLPNGSFSKYAKKQNNQWVVHKICCKSIVKPIDQANERQCTSIEKK
jgi:hypothetical protein